MAIRHYRKATGASPWDAARAVDRRTTELQKKFPGIFEQNAPPKPDRKPPNDSPKEPLQIELEKLAARGKFSPRNILPILDLLRNGHVAHHSWGLGKIKSCGVPALLRVTGTG